MIVQLKIHIEKSLYNYNFIKEYFINEFSSYINELLGNDVLGKFTESYENADMVLCDASSEKAYDKVLPIVIDNEISETYKNINSFPLPKEVGDENECKQLALNLTFAILSRLGIGNFHSRIFISYKRQDTEALALDLYKRLSSESLGFEVFLDTRKLDVGAKFMDEIRLSIVESDIFLFLDSVSYWKGVYTKKELYSAMSSCTGIIRISSQKDAFSLESKNVVRAFDKNTILIQKTNSIDDKEFTKLIKIIHNSRINFLKNKIERINSFCGVHKNERTSLWAFDIKGSMICPILGVPSSQRIEGIERKIMEKNNEKAAFSILYDHWNIPYAYNRHIQWIVNEKSNIGIETLQTVHKQTEVTQEKAPAVFLSASLPLDDEIKCDFAKVYEIIIRLVEEVINRNGKLVYGGHPTITPIIANMMNVQSMINGGENFPNVYLYQSKFFENTERPIENLEFPPSNIKNTEKGENLEDSLRIMRENMLGKEWPFTIGVFIGGKINNKGKCGVWDECRMFHSYHPKAKCVAFTDTGTDLDNLKKCVEKNESIDINVLNSVEEFVELLKVM